MPPKAGRRRGSLAPLLLALAATAALALWRQKAGQTTEVAGSSSGAPARTGAAGRAAAAAVAGATPAGQHPALAAVAAYGELSRQPADADASTHADLEGARQAVEKEEVAEGSTGAAGVLECLRHACPAVGRSGPAQLSASRPWGCAGRASSVRAIAVQTLTCVH